MREVLWRPAEADIERARVTAFRREVNERHGLALADWTSLRRWSVEQPARFWESVWHFCGVRGSRPWDEVLVDGDLMPGARWFAGARLNFAENLLRRGGGRDAIVFRGEGGARRRWSHDELLNLVARLARALRAEGVGPGDRVAGFLPNLPEAVAAMLAAASIGAVWSSCSPDFGIGGVLDRFGQIAPKVLFTADGYVYGGKRHDSLARVRGILDRLPSVRRTVVVPYVSDAPDLSGARGAVLFGEFDGKEPAAPPEFEPLPFDHPLFILYSSGTTGLPKCMVHSAGGTLLQHLKEHRLH
ncbi:MAG: AMP-binding protein, partial [Acidobacteriia bacterium]|nr:AMP-binding protein [Terriglobia bacterium]